MFATEGMSAENADFFRDWNRSIRHAYLRHPVRYAHHWAWQMILRRWVRYVLTFRHETRDAWGDGMFTGHAEDVPLPGGDHGYARVEVDRQWVLDGHCWYCAIVGTDPAVVHGERGTRCANVK